ncbi:GmrSD restriction endonuclease domain-containing protein [Mediterraneibacter faecis]|nr:DUF262 domain-containing protein [Fusicatenibacter saccharivorans]
MNNTITPDTESIINIVEKIDAGTVSLPEFQRDFVWDISRTFDLFDSLSKDVFIGSIIYGIPSFGLTVRELDTRPRKGTGSRKKLKTTYITEEEIKVKTSTANYKIILDGQQRITSIYRALKGIDEVWFIFKNSDELDDIYEDEKIPNIPLEALVYDITGTEDTEHLSIQLSTVYKRIKDSLMEDDLKEYYNDLEYVTHLSEDDQKFSFKSYVRFIQKLEDLLKSPKLVAYFLLDMSAEKFALFFERSNSLGVSLTFVDILVAKLISGFNLRQKIEDFEEENPNITLNREIIARSIAYLSSNGKKVDKKYILSSLTATDFNNYWDTAISLYKSAFDYLINNHFILNTKWMPYPNTIIPIMMFLNNLPNKNFSEMSEDQKIFFEYWYWNSVLSQRYVSSSNETILLDSYTLSCVARNEKITNKYYFKKLHSLINSYEDILSYNKKGSAIYIALLNFINYNAGGLLNWTNSSKISFSDKVDDHHIFPKEYLNSLADENIDVNMINCVANRTLIPKITNIKIGKKAPHVYMKELAETNEHFDLILNNHIIPTDITTGLYEGFYKDFLEERAKLIYNAINTKIFAKAETIEKKFLGTSKNSPDYGGSISIWGTYKKKTVTASFNIELQEVLYNGSRTSPSAAANNAKIDMGGNPTVSTNGWKWWKYKTAEGTESYIDDYRL